MIASHKNLYILCIFLFLQSSFSFSMMFKFDSNDSSDHNEDGKFKIELKINVPTLKKTKKQKQEEALSRQMKEWTKQIDEEIKEKEKRERKKRKGQENYDKKMQGYINSFVQLIDNPEASDDSVVKKLHKIDYIHEPSISYNDRYISPVYYAVIKNHLPSIKFLNTDHLMATSDERASGYMQIASEVGSEDITSYFLSDESGYNLSPFYALMGAIVVNNKRNIKKYCSDIQELTQKEFDLVNKYLISNIENLFKGTHLQDSSGNFIYEFAHEQFIKDRIKIISYINNKLNLDIENLKISLWGIVFNYADTFLHKNKRNRSHDDNQDKKVFLQYLTLLFEYNLLPENPSSKEIAVKLLSIIYCNDLADSTIELPFKTVELPDEKLKLYIKSATQHSDYSNKYLQMACQNEDYRLTKWIIDYGKNVYIWQKNHVAQTVLDIIFEKMVSNFDDHETEDDQNRNKNLLKIFTVLLKKKPMISTDMIRFIYSIEQDYLVEAINRYGTKDLLFQVITFEKNTALKTEIGISDQTKSDVLEGEKIPFGTIKVLCELEDYDKVRALFNANKPIDFGLSYRLNDKYNLNDEVRCESVPLQNDFIFILESLLKNNDIDSALKLILLQHNGLSPIKYLFCTYENIDSKDVHPLSDESKNSSKEYECNDFKFFVLKLALKQQIVALLEKHANGKFVIEDFKKFKGKIDFLFQRHYAITPDDLCYSRLSFKWRECIVKLHEPYVNLTIENICYNKEFLKKLNEYNDSTNSFKQYLLEMQEFLLSCESILPQNNDLYDYAMEVEEYINIENYLNLKYQMLF